MQSRIGRFQKYHNTLCLSSKIYHTHCLESLLVRREIENNAYVKFWKTNKVYCGTFENGLLKHFTRSHNKKSRALFIVDVH